MGFALRSKALFLSSALSAALLIASTGASAQSDPVYQFDIPAESLTQALKDFSAASSQQIVFSDDVVRNQKAPPLHGAYTRDQALQILLQGTGLHTEISKSGVIMVRRNSQSASITTPSTTANIETVTVTAEKRSEVLQNVPISMSVLGGEKLDKSSYIGVTEALNTLPNVAALAEQFQAGGTFLEIRGVSAAGPEYTGAGTVAFYVDGVPFGMIRSALVPDPNVYDLDRVEVLRGPQGTLYGANALNGVIRVLTNDPDLSNFDIKARALVSGTEGGDANYGGDLAVNVPIIDGKLAIRAAVGEQHESGWIDGPLGQDLNRSNVSNARLKIAAQPTSSLSVVLSAWHSRTASNAPSQSDANQQITAVFRQPMDNRFDAFGAKINYELSWATISSMTSYVDYWNSSVLDLTPFALNATVTATFASRVLSEELNLTSNQEGPWRWSVGAMYRDDREKDEQLLIFYPPPVFNDLVDHFEDTSASEAVYGEVGRRFLDDQLGIVFGLRYFHDDVTTQALEQVTGTPVPLNQFSTSFSALTPRAVLTWYASENLTVYTSYSQGFRSGELQSELVGSLVPDFPAVKPDRLTNYEVGAKGTLWDGRVSYDAAVFDIYWHNIQQQLDVPSAALGGGFVLVLVNGGSASGQGAEFSLNTQPFDNLTVGANFGWNNLHFDSDVISGGSVIFPKGARPNFSPEYTAGVSAAYNFPLVVLGAEGILSASANYISPLNTTYLTAGIQHADPLILARTSFEIRFPHSWAATFYVDNVNNYDGTQQTYFGIPQWDQRLRPRTYGVRIDYALEP